MTLAKQDLLSQGELGWWGLVHSDEGLAPAQLRVSSSGSDADRCAGPRHGQRSDSPEILAGLRQAYAGNKREVSANLDHLAMDTGIPRKRLKSLANQWGFRTQAESRPWTAEEFAYLRESLGSVSVAQIARKLKRSRSAINHKAGFLKRSLRVNDGYNIATLREVFGLSYPRVNGWVKRGLLGKAHGHGGMGHEVRFSEANVIRFIRKYPYEYDLSRVDQIWFKAMMFGRLAEYGDRV